MTSTKFLAAGDCSFVIEFGAEISPEINRNIKKLMLDLEEQNIDGLMEIIPTYCSMLINYNPCKITYKELEKKIKKLLKNITKSEEEDEVKLIEIPTLYSDEYGPDLSYVAEYNGLTKEEVIKIHTSTDYLVYMLGFMPGFTYLGGMSERIATPRLESPRLQILPGSVGIAGKQTGIYPSLSPGGWRIIGRTPLKLYNVKSENPVFISSGDYVRYIAIDEEEYEKIQAEVEEGVYKINIRKVKRGELNV